jgi:hypothetical protein
MASRLTGNYCGTFLPKPCLTGLAKLTINSMRSVPPTATVKINIILNIFNVTSQFIRFQHLTFPPLCLSSDDREQEVPRYYFFDMMFIASFSKSANQYL